jgi:mitosis inhibitor protein kinase SWE1
LRELGKHEHILELIDSWEQYDHLFIQTELCENGSLDIFLRDYGNIERLDEFRVWKILVELTLGLQHIHNSNYIHLDIKPANVFITFEGTLKIGDFGLATHLPVPAGLEREGDREYIAPEILELQQYGKEADIFSLGMTILESAANVCLPDNGLPWQKLRSGDLSDAPRLSSSDEARLGVGSVEEDGMDVDGGATVQYAKGLQPGKLDEIVKWMLSPKPGDRPSCQDLLQNEQVRWVYSRRRAGAVIYEGDFGPESEVDEDKEEMEDVDWQMEL